MRDKLETARLSWQDGAVLRSDTFEDIYYSDTDGLAESQHVFINGNNLIKQFAAINAHNDKQTFTVAELGFGTGLNILALWQAWQQRGHGFGHLHIFSVEGFPLSPQSFREAQYHISERWPELKLLSKALEEQYPRLIPGYHVLRLSKDTTLTLALGHVESCLATAHFKANAWFLDGFSPAQNPEMWSEQVMMQISRLSAPKATFATFTVAGVVRRGLEKSGFDLFKKPGFGRKREMLTGLLVRPQPIAQKKQPWLSYEAIARPTGKRVLIVGAGIAGAAASWHMQRAGFEVSIIDENGPASGASGNPAGIVLPRLDLGETPAAHFYRDAWLYTINLIGELDKDKKILTSQGGIIASCNDEMDQKHERLISNNSLPSDLLKVINNEELAESSGLTEFEPGGTRHLEVTNGGVIHPKAFVTVLLGDIQVQKARLATINREQPGNPIHAILQVEQDIFDLETDYIIFASAAHAGVSLDGPYIKQSLGQVDVLATAPPHKALTFGHYVAPYGNHCVIGATYEDVGAKTMMEPTKERQHQNFEAIQSVLKRKLTDAPLYQSRVSCRAVTADRHPIVGALPDWSFTQENYMGLRTGIQRDYANMAYQPGIFILSGLGSRGFTTASYCAALIASLIQDTPCPMTKEQMELVHPARFAIRNLRKPYKQNI